MKRSLLIFLTACGGGSDTPKLDASHSGDAPVTQHDANGTDAAADGPGGGPYRHTVTIDGTDDFVPAEVFATTSSPSFSARVSWDADNLYLGYSGPDLDPTATGASTRWLFAYLDVDPGAATGSGVSRTYNTQSATLPTGFGADYYLRWKADATFSSLEMWDGAHWVASSTAPNTGHSGQYVELSIPRSALGSPGKLGVATWMINEENLAEGTFAGIYTGNFTDGYDADVTRYLKIDFASSRVPNDPANEAP